MLRAHWGSEAAHWQARRVLKGHETCDLEDPAALTALLESSGPVVMMAGVVPGPGRDLDANATLAEAVLRAAPPGTRVLLASSAAVYGRGPTTEDTPPAPLSDYGHAMVAREEIAARLGTARGVEVCALRIGNVAGADAILGGWRPGFTLDRFTDGTTPRRSYIGPRTLAAVIAALIQHTRPLPPVLNIAAPGVVAMGDLLETASLEYQTRAAPPEALPEVRLDITRLEGHVTLTPETGTATALVAEWQAMERAQ